MRWYDFIFGGSKAAQSFYSLIAIIIGYCTMNMELRGANFLAFGAMCLACAGIYGWYRVKEYQVKNGQAK